jgi:DNA mismatch endonuclease (patch repair protein)
MDHVSPAVRSRIMASVGSKNTTPELAVRRAIHSAGLRYRLHDPRLPGKPDIVLPSRRVALFVHGCFWHRCPLCRNGAKGVGSNKNYWLPKLARNAARDRKIKASLRRLGWKVYVIWECQTKDSHELNRIVRSVEKMRLTRRR